MPCFILFYSQRAYRRAFADEMLKALYEYRRNAGK